MKQRGGMPYDVVAIETDEIAKFWTNAEEGAFHRLMRHQWINGSIPNNITKIAVIIREPIAEAEAIWMALEKSFPVCPDDPARRMNPKTEKERQFVEHSSQKRSVAGQIGNAVKYGKPMPEAYQNIDKSRNAIAPQLNSSQLNSKEGSSTAGNSPQSGDVIAQAQLALIPSEADQQGAEILFNIWKQHHGSLPECLGFTDERRKKAATLLNKHKSNRVQFVDQFEKAVKRAAASHFCCGGGKDGWKLTFDWLIENNKNYLKVLEGHYDNRTTGNQKLAEKIKVGMKAQAASGRKG